MSEKPEEIVSVVEVEIVKPLSDGVTWKDLGDRLRDLESFAHRIMNRCVSTVAVVDAGRRIAWLEDPTRTGKGKAGKIDVTSAPPATEKDAPLQTICYRAAIVAVEEQRAFWAEAAGKSDAALRRAKTEKERALLAGDLARALRRSSISLPSNMVLASSGLAWARYGVWRKTSAQGGSSLPSFRAGAPVMLGASGISVERDGNGYALVANLGAGPWRIAIAPAGGSAHATMRAVTTPGSGWTVADAKVMHGRAKKWVVKLTVRRPKPATILDAKNVLAVHLGVRNAITLATSTGFGRVVDRGDQVLHMKAQMRSRRERMGSAGRMGGAGRAGHGSTRRSERVARLEDAEARFVKTKIQQWAADVAKWAKLKGCGVVLVESYSPKAMADAAENEHVQRLLRRWPFAATRDAIRWACTKAGIAVQDVASGHDSTTCPQCLHVDAGNQDAGKFVCGACGFERDVDVVAAWNILRREGFDAFAKSMEREKQLAAALAAEE